MEDLKSFVYLSLFDSGKRVLNYLSFGNKIPMLPNKKEEIRRNEFYNAIRSNNIENLDKLINEWPHSLEELDEVLSSAYEELKLKNVWLEDETEIFIENKLINLRFFSNTSRDDQSIGHVDLNNTKERIDLTLESIRLLKTDYSNIEKVDGKFIFLTRCIAKNIHILKQQLKSTHDGLPWEQMEFCLVIFISSYTKIQEINLFYRTTLNKNRILNHLENFANKLEVQKGKLQSSEQEQVITKSMNCYPQFEELQKDNQQIREVQSLLKLNDHIKNKVLISNPKKKDGQLVITKALQLIGEHLKSSLEFSKLSNVTATTREQENTVDIIVDLRNSLSLLANSFSDRIETEENKDLNFFSNAHEDIRKVGDVITCILNELNANKNEVFLTTKLISLRSFFIASAKDPNLIKGDNDKNALIQQILQSISLLKKNYSNMEEVDEKFIFVTKSIEQNISKIKRQVKLTNDRLLWEEMEFCLASFVNSYTKKQEMNLFYRGLFNKFRVLSHLESFGKKLEDGNLESEPVVTTKSCPGFESLYKDYQQIRDVHSLKKISDHIELALSANPKERDGQLIITRVLQVIGEHLKNTQGSPKLSDAISELLLLSLQKTARKIIIELRDLLSHDDNDSLSKRIEIEKNLDDNFFFNVKNDMKKVGDVITDILYNNEIDTIRILLKKIVASKNSEEIKGVAELLTTFQFDKIMVSKNFKMTELEKLQKLVNELNDNISDKTDSEKDMFTQIFNELKCAGSPSENLRSDYINGIAIIRNLSDTIALRKLDKKCIEGMKFLVNKVLSNITSKINSRRYKKIWELSLQIYVSARERCNLDEVTRLVFEIFQITKFETGNIKWIEKFREMLNEKNSFTPAKEERNEQEKIYKVTKEKCDDQLAVKLTELKGILIKNSLSDSATEKLAVYKNDKKIQAVVEMLILEIMAILDSSKNYLENNLLFLDDNAPLLNGKCLRNHLAHDNALFDVLLSDPSMAVILNAIKLTEENILASKKKIGKLVKDDPIKLRENYNRGLSIISNQERMFVALEEGNIETLADCLGKGVDVNARNINSWTTLHFAAKGPSLEVAKFIFHILFLNFGCITFIDFNGQSPLHIAAAHGRKSIVEFFVKKTHLKVDAINNRGETPLQLAAQNGQMDTVEILLKSKAITVIQDVRGRSPVHYAIYNNHTDVAKILLKEDENVENKTIENYTPLHIAADCGNLDLVNFLLENNAQVNAKTDLDRTPLHLAASSDHVEVVNALIINGADVNATDLNNSTPLHYAIEDGHEVIANILLKHTDNLNASEKIFGNSLLHYAARFGRLEVVKNLLECGADANFLNFENKTPLHFAALIGHSKICKVFLQHGLTIIDTRDKNNNTPLHCAADRGHTEAAALLIENGADFNAKGNANITPLYTAVQKGHKGVIDLLIRRKAEVNSKNTNGCTTLYVAAINGIKDVLDILIENKAEVNAAANDGMTPLHVAALRGHGDAVDLLVRSNAEVNARADDGLTPLHAAVLGGHRDVVYFLIENNAQVNEIGMSQKVVTENEADGYITMSIVTPLASAIRSNHKEIVEVLVKFGANVTVDALKIAISTGFPDIVKILLDSADIVNMLVNTEITSLLHLAVNKGNKEIVNVLITKGADPNDIAVTNKIPMTPLCLAARNGDEEVVKILIAGGANVNLKLNITPLHVAAAMGHSIVVNVLLKNQADVNVKSRDNITPVELAVICGHLQVLKMFLRDKKLLDKEIKRINCSTLLHIASQESNLQMVEYLVDEGFDINSRNASGAKPMHIAAGQGHKDTVDYFLRTKGLSINDPGETNLTLLHYAVVRDNLEFVKYLIMHGADVNAKDGRGITALHLTACLGYKEIIQVLLKNGAIYNAVDHRNTKPLETTKDQDVIKLLAATDKLFLSVERNSSSQVKSSIKAGAYVNAKNNENLTPLHYAAWKGYEGVVKILLQNRANPNVVGNNGLTPLHYAAKFSRLKIMKALLSNYAIYNPVSDDGKTPSDLTKDKSITNLFKLVDDSFNSIKRGDPQVVDKLHKIKNKDTIKAIMGARSRENKTLVVTAMQSNFSKFEQLKEISQGDISSKIKTALELFNKGNYQKALFRFNKAFIKRISILGSDNPGTLDIQTYIAQVLFAQGDYQEALNTYEEIFQKQKEILGFGSKDTLTIRRSIAVVLHRLGKCEEAFKIHQEVYQKQEELLGSNHLETLVTQLHIVLLLRMQGKYEEALNIVRTVFEKRNEILELLTGATLSTAALFQSDLELFKNYKYYILEVPETVSYGIDHTDACPALFHLDEEYIQLKKYSEASKVHEKILNLQKYVLGPNHPKTLKTQYIIANLLFTQGKWIDAFKAYKEGLDPIKAVCGPYHPIVVHILEKLEILHLRISDVSLKEKLPLPHKSTAPGMGDI